MKVIELHPSLSQIQASRPVPEWPTDPRALARAARSLWNRGEHEHAIVTLVYAFPTLRRRALLRRPGFNPFDPVAFSRAARGPSFGAGARQAAALLLYIWAPRRKWRPPLKFDLERALSCWDPEHCSAFSAWAAEAWFR